MTKTRWCGNLSSLSSAELNYKSCTQQQQKQEKKNKIKGNIKIYPCNKYCENRRHRPPANNKKTKQNTNHFALYTYRKFFL